MEKSYKKNGGKLTLAFVLILVGITAILSASFAGLSALITYDAGGSEVGAFDFKNNTVDLDLFPSDYIFPGDGGSAVFSLPNFAGYTPSWTMKEVNDSVIPVIFSIGNAYYSKYSFTDSLYFKNLDGDYASCADVSADGADILVNIADGVAVKWVWPNTLYELSGEDYIESTSAEASEYITYSESLCSCTYSFDSSLATAMSSVTVNNKPHVPKAYVTSDADAETQYVELITPNISASNTITCTNGLYYANDIAITLIHEGKAISPTASTVISKDDYYAFLVTDTTPYTITSFTESISEYADLMRVSEDKYEISPVSGNTYTLTTSEERLRIIKVYPTVMNAAQASISLSFTATISTY